MVKSDFSVSILVFKGYTFGCVSVFECIQVLSVLEGVKRLYLS